MGEIPLTSSLQFAAIEHLTQLTYPPSLHVSIYNLDLYPGSHQPGLYDLGISLGVTNPGAVIVLALPTASNVWRLTTRHWCSVEKHPRPYRRLGV